MIMKSTEGPRQVVMAGHVDLFQLHVADAVLEASLPTHSRNIDLKSDGSLLPRVFTVAGALDSYPTVKVLYLRSGVD